jgi:ABC-type taurine transport system substrate-binding protein
VGNHYLSPQEQINARYLGTSSQAGALADTLKSTADFHVSQNNLEQAGSLSVYQDAVTSHFIEEALKLGK